ncbi:MAG: DUF11 domain-containing protein, partial [Candidatus Portnoybacteria bacterium]|nr:DUF11 domain-containing protein [Candidatus Portnoybacteria bacterium]
FKSKVLSENNFYNGTTELINHAYANAANHALIQDSATIEVYKEEDLDNPELEIDKLTRNLSRGSSNWTKTVYAEPGDEIEFLIRVQSIGNTEAENVRVEDDLPSRLNYVQNSTTVDGYSKSDGITSGYISIGDMYVGESKEIRFKTKVASENNFSSTITTLTNKAYAWANDVSKINDTAYVKVQKETTQENYDISISKLGRNITRNQSNWAETSLASPSQQIEFSIQITNIGNQELTNVRVWDALPYQLLMVDGSTRINGADWGGDVTGSGLDIGTLNPGETKTIKFIATVASSENFGSGSTTLINTAYVSADRVGQLADQASVIVNKQGEVLGATTVPTGMNLAGLIFVLIISLIVSIFLYLRIREDKLLDMQANGGKLAKAIASTYFKTKLALRITKLRFKQIYW